MKKEEKDNVSFWQVFYDDTSMLFFLGVVIPTCLYIIWGVMEYANAPIAVLKGP